MVAIPAGSLNGSTITAFQIGKYEVTKAEYRRFVNATGYTGPNPHCYKDNGTTQPVRGTDNWENPPFASNESTPVLCVSDEDANAYVRWLAQTTGKPYRLPSAVEWQLAGNGGGTTLYDLPPEQICRFGNVNDQSGYKILGPLRGYPDLPYFACSDGAVYPTVVGMYEPNKYGVYDMIGNVNEIVADCVHDTVPAGVAAPTDGSAWVTNCSSTFRMALGESYYATDLTSFSWRIAMSARGTIEGFRVALRAPVSAPTPETVAFELALEQARTEERARRALVK